MAKKKKAPMPAHVRATLIEKLTEQRDTMMLRCRQLLDDGKLDEGRKLFARLEKVIEDLEESERGAR